MARESIQQSKAVSEVTFKRNLRAEHSITVVGFENKDNLVCLCNSQEVKIARY